MMSSDGIGEWLLLPGISGVPDFIRTTVFQHVGAGARRDRSVVPCYHKPDGNDYFSGQKWMLSWDILPYEVLRGAAYHDTI